jgi:hypothetical protein
MPVNLHYILILQWVKVGLEELGSNLENELLRTDKDFRTFLNLILKENFC